MKKYYFKKIFWGEDKSTEVKFYVSKVITPSVQPITSVMGAVFDKNNNLLLTKPARGWGLPGGHLEPGETPEVCLIRECLEEAEVEINNLQLIGYWKIKKIRDIDANKKYPPIAYQLLYLADVIKVHDFKQEHEVSERSFVKPHDVGEVHHNYENFKPILEYILSTSSALEL